MTDDLREKDITRLTSQLKSKDMVMRRQAAGELGRSKDKRAVEPLIRALRDEEEYVRWNVAEALGQIGDARAVEPLITALKDDSEDVRTWAARALGKIRDTRAVEPLITALKDKDKGKGIRRLLDKEEVSRRSGMYSALTETLAETRDARAVKPLVGLLKNGDYDMRERAALLLGTTGDISALGPLVGALADGDSAVENAAANALEKIDPNWRKSEAAKAAISSFVLLLGGEAGNIAAKALEKINPDWKNCEEARAAIPLLVAALHDEDDIVRKEAAETLGSLGWRPSDDTQRALHVVAVKKWKEAVNLGDAAVEPLTVALKGKNIEINIAAAAALAEIGNRQGIEWLIDSLNAEEFTPYMCEKAITALQKIRTPEAQQAIAEYSAHQKSREEAIQRLVVEQVSTAQMEAFALQSVKGALNKLPEVNTGDWIVTNEGKFGPVNPRSWPGTDRIFDSIEDCIEELKKDADEGKVRGIAKVVAHLPRWIGKKEANRNQVLWAATHNALIVEKHFKSQSYGTYNQNTLVERKVIVRNTDGKLYRFFTWIE